MWAPLDRGGKLSQVPIKKLLFHIGDTKRWLVRLRKRKSRVQILYPPKMVDILRGSDRTHGNPFERIVGLAIQHTQKIYESKGKIPTSSRRKSWFLQNLQEVHEMGGDVGTITWRGQIPTSVLSRNIFFTPLVSCTPHELGQQVVFFNRSQARRAIIRKIMM